jgi:hypothetical protein
MLLAMQLIWSKAALPCPFLIKPEQVGQNFVVGQGAAAPIIAPAIGIGHRFIQRAVGVAQSGGRALYRLVRVRFFSALPQRHH